jgi:hypothetical protein
MVHTLQPTQSPSFTSFAPVSELMPMASVGQAALHQASAHWVQV